MRTFKEFGQSYVNWVLRLGRWKSALLGFVALALMALIVQGSLNYLITGRIHADDFMHSVIFGMVSAPLVIYFFNLIVERLERSRIQLEQSLFDLGTLREQDAYLNATLEKNNRDKSILMATISHELRTPLNGIVGLSRILLEEGNLTEQQEEYLKTIHISASSLGHIFSDLIDLEKIDSRRIELFRTEVEFSQFISDISNFANLMADQRKIKFHINYPDDLPNFIFVDNARLSQILWNLISNAVKFTPAGGDISLTIKRLDHNHFNFSVKDTGIGIPRSEHRKVFSMFYQADNSHERKALGSGIGLSISKSIAHLMGGDLTLESEENQGATFTLTIQADTVEEVKKVQINDHALKVLLVEDIEVNVVVARAMLEKFGCEVDVAMSGKQAFECFEQDSYDLLLLDIQLPDITGFDIAKTLRQRYEQEEMDYLPLLIALTANIMQTKEEYQQQGMDDVLRKPLSLEALAECLNKYFGSDFSESTSTSSVLNIDEDDENSPFNKKILSELVEVMGAKAVLANLVLFAKLMPDYMTNLYRYLAMWQSTQDAESRKHTAEEAHKIKGALASVGLKRLRQVAQLAQNDDGEVWEQGIEGWVEQLDSQWQADLALAEAWIKTFKA